MICFGARPTRAAVLLLAGTLLAACARATVREISYPAVPDVQEVDLTWQPREGMRLVHRVTTEVEATGPLTRPVADRDKKQHMTLSRIMEVARVGPDYFDVRFVQDGATLPATLRFSRAWAPIEIRPDDPSALGEKDRDALDAALKQLGEPLAQAAKFFGRWKVGETRPFDIRLSGIPDTSGTGQGSMTFRRVVVIDGRQAAEFDWQGQTEFLFTGDPGKGAPGRMTISGREWRDLATGASLRLTAKANAEFTRQGQPTRVAYETAEVLDMTESRL